MIFNRHFNLEGRHAFLSASKGSWVNYDEEKLARVFFTSKQAQKGTRIHAVASELIALKMKQSTRKTTVNMYVNDAIGYRMTPEQPLFYSENCFGTPDAISFRRNKLRIHDLKTGETKASFRQLMIYAALFCLEYKFKPFEIEIELRIYQNDEVLALEPDPDEIVHIMDRIITFDKFIRELEEEDMD